MSKQRKPIIVSFFSGGGGLDIGFHNAGFELAAATDIKNDSCETLKENASRYYPKAKIIQADIRDLKASDIYEGQPDFIIGGPPCQTFSAIGRRAGGAMGTLDPRGNLFEHYSRLLNDFKPKGFLFENVRGILSSHEGKDWERVLKTFSELGFKLKYRLLDAAGYGVPQHRERVILVGYKENEFFFPRPTHGPDAFPPCNYYTPREALKDLKIDIKKLFRDGGKYDHLIKDIPPGMNYLYYTKEMGHPTPCFAWRSKFSDFLYKAHPNNPVKTIVARIGGYSGPFHWTGRALDIKEFKRLQGFPDNYVITGNELSQMRQIGDSVAPPFAHALALAVKKTIFNKNVNLELLEDTDTLSFDKRKGVKAQQTRLISKNINLKQITFSWLVGSGNGPHASVKRLPLISTKIANSKEQFILYTSNSVLKFIEKSTPNAWRVTQIYEGRKVILNIACQEIKKSSAPAITLKIKFDNDIFSNFQEITANLYTLDPQKIFIIWDIVNDFIEGHSSYPSIYELYGHFTEPHPKFQLELETYVKGKSHPYIKFFEHFSSFNTVNQFNRFDLLETLGFNVQDEMVWIKEMRALRFDVRTNATNKTIPNGMFRCCYPFTMPIKRKSYITLNG